MSRRTTPATFKVFAIAVLLLASLISSCLGEGEQLAMLIINNSNQSIQVNMAQDTQCMSTGFSPDQLESYYTSWNAPSLYGWGQRQGVDYTTLNNYLQGCKTNLQVSNLALFRAPITGTTTIPAFQNSRGHHKVFETKTTNCGTKRPYKRFSITTSKGLINYQITQYGLPEMNDPWELTVFTGKGPYPIKIGSYGEKKPRPYKALPNATQVYDCGYSESQSLCHGPTPDRVDEIIVQNSIDVIRQVGVGRSATCLLLAGEDSPLDNEQDCLRSRTPDAFARSDLQSTSPEKDRASINLARMMEPIIYSITDDNENPDQETFSIHLSKDKAISLAQPEHQSTTGCSCDSLLNTQRQWCLPLRKNADALVTRYFSRHNLTFPILHEQTFRKQYERLWESAPTRCCGICKQRSRGKLLLPTLYAVFAYASLLETSQPQQNVARAKSFFRMAQEVDMFQVLDDDVGIESVQLLLLMGKYLQSTEQLSKFKNISGLSIWMAQSMGLHYSVGEAQNRGLLADPATQLECEMRARVWYGCVLNERDKPQYLSFERSVGAAISNNTPPLPRAIDDDQLSDVVGRDGEQPEGSPSTMEIFIATIKLHEILSQALSRENCCLQIASDSGVAIQSLLRLDNLMHDWLDELPEHLHPVSFQEDSQLNSTSYIKKHGAQPQSATFVQAAARKLHIRYLHASQIILRPALDLYFKKAQSQRSSLKKRQRHDDLENIMFTTMAAKCVVSAMTIIELLGAESEAHIFVAWWINIAYLHTCGSTILMARLCTFNDAKFNRKSLLSSWNMCLKTLERYAGISSIARRSSYLLRQSAESLIFAGRRQVTNRGGDTEETSDKIPRSGEHDGMELESQFNTYVARANVTETLVQEAPTMNPLTQKQLQTSNSRLFEPSDDPTGIALPDSNLDFGIPPDLDDNFWASCLDLPSWSLMPSLEQLEKSPPRFDF